MSDTIIVAIITVLGATLPQMFNKIIEYHKELKFKKIELQENGQKQAIINFINSVANCMNNNVNITNEQRTNYFKSAYTLFAYFPKLDFILIKSLGDILDGSSHAIQSKLSKVISELSKLLSEI